MRGLAWACPRRPNSKQNQHTDHLIMGKHVDRRLKHSDQLAQQERDAGQGHRPAHPGRARDRFSHEFISAMLADFREHGRKTIGRVRARRPDAYLKICAMIPPREMTLTSENLSAMTDDELREYQRA